jgi:MYXO-CTERM domain-containing protein
MGVPSVLAFAVASFAFVGVARADIVVPEPKRDACSGKKDNDACELEGKAGTCKKQTCSRKVGGVLNPSVVDEDCILCDLAPDKTKTEAPTPTPTDTDPPKPDPTKPDPTAPSPAEPTKATPTTATPTADASSPEEVKSDASQPAPAKTEAKAEEKAGCSVSTDATPLASMAFGLSLLVLARPRRR